MKGYSFLDGSLLGQRTYLVEKLSLPREEPQVIFAVRQRNTSQVHVPFWLFASSVNCDLGGQWSMDIERGGGGVIASHADDLRGSWGRNA